MRPLWNGSISFGLVNIPVRLFSGSRHREGLDLDMLHKDDKSPIRYARVCRRDGKEIPWDDIVKGYEYREGDYVVLTKAELEKVAAHKSQTIDIQQFVEEGEIDIRYFEKPYYLEPVKGGEKAYRLLHEALLKADKLALAKFIFHEREHVGAIKPVGESLVFNQMRFPADIRDTSELKFPTTEITKEELAVALKFINQETKPFKPARLHDTYTEELEDMIEAKTKGKKLPAHQPKHTPEKTSATDLMSKLKASLKGV